MDRSNKDKGRTENQLLGLPGEKGSINTDLDHFLESIEKSYKIIKNWIKLEDEKHCNAKDSALNHP